MCIRYAVQIPCDFVRQVARPNDQELRKLHVGPKHHERQQKIAEVVEVSRGNNFDNGSDSPEKAQHQNRESERAENLADQNDDQKDCRVPVGFK